MCKRNERKRIMIHYVIDFFISLVISYPVSFFYFKFKYDYKKDKYIEYLEKELHDLKERERISRKIIDDKNKKLNELRKLENNERNTLSPN